MRLALIRAALARIAGPRVVNGGMPLAQIRAALARIAGRRAPVRRGPNGEPQPAPNPVRLTTTAGLLARAHRVASGAMHLAQIRAVSARIAGRRVRGRRVRGHRVERAAMRLAQIRAALAKIAGRSVPVRRVRDGAQAIAPMHGRSAMIAGRRVRALGTPPIAAGVTVHASGPRAMTRVTSHLCGIASLCALGWAAPALAGPAPAPLRFAGRLQILSGAAVTWPQLYDGSHHIAAYVPAEAELALRVSGMLSLGIGGAGYLAPFSLTTCSDAPAARAHAATAFGTVRLDFNNSRDGSWWSPWMALRTGIAAQDGVASGDPCQEQLGLGLYLGPRLGIDLWMGRAAVTFAFGYDHLPRADAVALQTGLTLRLF